ncbi:hypothetical protein [Scytonema sp. HK-05]|nr:hypothetical protein [Scytonema sp. HK-05]
MNYSASRLDEVIIYLCPSVSICGSPNLMYCTQLKEPLYGLVGAKPLVY